MAFAQVNGKVVSTPVAPGREVLARRGAMLAYTGDVGFAPVHMGPGGAGGMLGRMVAGEQVPMMVAQGTGTVHYGYGGLYLTIVELDGSGPLSVESDRPLPPRTSSGSVAIGHDSDDVRVRGRPRRGRRARGLRLGEPDEAESR
jgi:Mitochondrial biogenesis AIM24